MSVCADYFFVGLPGSHLLSCEGIDKTEDFKIETLLTSDVEAPITDVLDIDDR